MNAHCSTPLFENKAKTFSEIPENVSDSSYLKKIYKVFAFFPVVTKIKKILVFNWTYSPQSKKIVLIVSRT